MLVSHGYEFIFTKTHKTAGTSVESFFERFCMPEEEWEPLDARPMYVGKEGIIGSRGKVPGYRENKFRHHMPAEEIRDYIGSEVWNRYFKFTVVRDPFDKLVSGYYNKRHKIIRQGRKSRNRAYPMYYASSVLRKYGCRRASSAIDIHSFRRWLKSAGNTDRQAYMIDGSICVDYFIHYERLTEGIREVCENLGIEFDEAYVRKFKTGLRNKEIPLADFYDEGSIEIVRKLYGFEIDYFGYQPPNRA